MRRSFLKSSLAFALASGSGLPSWLLGTPEARAQGGKPVAVTVPIGDWIGYTPWYVAKERGFDVANGVSIIPIRIATSADVTAALSTGQISSAHTNIPATTQRQAAGVDFKLVLFMGLSVTGDALIAGKGINSIKDLTGKRIALVRDSQREYLLRLALKNAGMAMNNLTILDVNSDELAGLAFSTGRVDAAVTYEPYISRSLAHNPDAKRIASAGDFPGSVSDSWIVSTKFLKDYPDAVVGMIRAWDAAVKYINENPEDAFQAIVKRSAMKIDDLRSSYATIKLYRAAEGRSFMEKQLVPMANEITGIMREFGTLRGSPDFQAIVDLGPITRATQ
ncbi:ABC transporter substrate-binding protein [Boseaceae bacterium BT-24-1]|nr:ABC transporter substrate-binding protein [Boseaceae bacterium BT-24-1]